MSNHTPGPWRATLTRGKHGYSDFYNVLGPQYEICCMMGVDNEDKANARLIAAAPDLLEAAKEVLAQAGDFEREHSHYAALSAAIKRAEEVSHE